MAKIKHCPFCGEMPVVEMEVYGGPYIISCNNLKCKKYPSVRGATKKLVVEMWNLCADNFESKKQREESK